LTSKAREIEADEDKSAADELLASQQAATTAKGQAMTGKCFPI
jgi:hypothetical protein